MENQRITVDQLMAEDSTFTESSFISKVDNIFIMLYSGIMLGNLERIKHKLSDSMIEYYQNMINLCSYSIIRRILCQSYTLINNIYSQ